MFLIFEKGQEWQACQLAGVEPRTVEVSPADPVAYVLSINLHRRHLTPSQRAMVGARARKWYDDEAARRQREAQERGRMKQKGIQAQVPESIFGQARDEAGKAVGVGGKMIDRATKVIKEAKPELVEAVKLLDAVARLVESFRVALGQVMATDERARLFEAMTSENMN